jgi:hypothetical protein
MRDYKKPDLNKPRYRTKVIAFKNAEFFKLFKQKYPQYKDIPNETLRKIIETHHKYIWETAIENRDGVELQDGLGYIFIGSLNITRKKEGINIDHKRSALCGKEVIHRNLNTDGRMGKIIYSNYKSKYKLQDRELWMFQGHRDFTRAVAEIYPKQYKKYIELENYIRIGKLFEKNQRKSIAMSISAKDDISNYNEFDID